ncbi:MAG: hypothetical protein OES32_07470 [Acidobacteriota bacterium]|nr:hypothetical protein [Acidobacteriota bacterium]
MKERARRPAIARTAQDPDAPPAERPGKGGLALALGVLLAVPAASLGLAAERAALVTTPHFAFYDDFATNLNDALIAAGVERNFDRPELFHSGAEESCFGELPPSARAGWNRAVDYYAEIISPAGFDDRQQLLPRLQLAGLGESVQDDGARRFVEIARGFRAAAAPAYEACRWRAQDEENRLWIEALQSQLAAHEETIARRLEELYGTPWDGLPIPVDVVETVSWRGANSVILYPAGGHILISSSYEGQAALEIVFHEASHLLMDRGDPVQRALAEAASALGMPRPDDLWHVVLFYTTGETVRRVLEEAGDPEYTPMIYSIFERSSWVRYRDALEGTWPAYLKGERTLPEAAAELMAAVGEGAGHEER